MVAARAIRDDVGRGAFAHAGDAVDDTLAVDDEAEGPAYRRVKLTVWEGGVEDCPIEAQAYRVINPTGPHLPARGYLDKIIRGTQMGSLPAGWVTWVRGIGAK